MFSRTNVIENEPANEKTEREKCWERNKDKAWASKFQYGP